MCDAPSRSMVHVYFVGHCAGAAEVSLPPSPLPSYVHLNISCNVVAIQKGEVLSTFERAITAFSRPVDPDYEDGDQQVSHDFAGFWSLLWCSKQPRRL